MLGQSREECALRAGAPTFVYGELWLSSVPSDAVRGRLWLSVNVCLLASLQHLFRNLNTKQRFEYFQICRLERFLCSSVMKRKLGASSASGSGAPQPAEFSAAAQKLVADIAAFGRLPTRTATTSPEEKQLAERLKKQPPSIRNAIKQEVLSRNDAPQRWLFNSSHGRSVSSQPILQHAVTA